MRGLIFSIKRYSIHDGPGIRVTFFLKGCPLSCPWCHNPEGISPYPVPVVNKRRIGEKEYRTTEQAGIYYTAEEIVEIAAKDKIFIEESSGGVTFSGGEPMMQFNFLLAALKLFKMAGFHTALDTSGYSTSENFREIIRYTDLFLYDIKHLDNNKHIRLTGVSNSIILDNFRLILDSGRDIMLRIPVIPGINDDAEHFDALKSFIIDHRAGNIKKINLLPYHRIGFSKYAKFGLQYRMSDTKPPSGERMKELKAFFSGTGIKVKTGG